MQDESIMRIGYSYSRYSSLPQGEGDSVRRQTKGAVDWCKRHNVQLDKTRTYLDRGRSAYHGRHRQKGGALAAFLSEVERGDIPRGSLLIIENLDRLSREDAWDALSLLTGLVNSGISVVVLSPSEMIYERGCDLTAMIFAMVEFGRANSESKSKAHRISANWDEKRKAVRENGAIMTARTPGWIEVKGAKLVLIPDRAKLVRRMFDLAIKGYGLSLIVRELTRDEVPVWGRSTHGWSKAYVHKIISGRAVLGEYQPIKDGKPSGDILPDYYPAVIDETTWLQAQAALARRKESHNRGPIGEKVATLFGGLLRDAVTKDHLRIAWQTRGVKDKTRQKRRVLVTAKSMEGAAPSLSFPHDIFEQAILSLLKEVNPVDVLGKEPESEGASVAAELASKEQRSRQIEAELTGDGDDVPALVRVLRSLSDECDGLRKRLAAIRQKEANPRGVAWSEALTLIDVAKDEANRLRLRELLRTIIGEVWILIVPRRSHRLAAVQIYFRGDGRRDYLILYQAKANGRSGFWLARSLPPGIAPGDFDLRKKACVASMTKKLAEYDLDSLAAKMK